MSYFRGDRTGNRSRKRDPEKTSLKTSFQEFVSLRTSTGHSHPDWAIRFQFRKKHHEKSPPFR